MMDRWEYRPPRSGKDFQKRWPLQNALPSRDTIKKGVADPTSPIKMAK
jgi:hypothetical protein